ncbi:ilvB operon leader peptide IvbL [Yersinia alsatica]|uniref:IlvB operon leader peptide IvbL n=1 Tax=Yersinia alsatica TaxID=2890317 RepID=A0ABY5UK11_9GAMM|nr:MULTISPECIES: ilvB operon leader peptide IvbL [Yersinia]OVZ92937.1 ilvB operon leader peptide IvbL [Yersinia frederiksenii]OWF70592.1 amino acid biosynthesis protein [Yersinia frederiksenii]OWF82886.1 amino acid biosynthesis protein [Yersinia frederiksenii]UWM43831.1 ilvB operon leader peptide IvbL [Yersinia alsatica]
MRYPVNYSTANFALLNTAHVDAVVVVRVVVVVGSAP